MGLLLRLAAHSEDQLWVANVAGIQAGDTLTQERPVMTDEAILARFAKVWQARWMKHHHVQSGHWDQICGFLDRTAPSVSWTCAPWTVDRFRQAVRHKKPRAAKGPDGVAQPDLCALPVAACETLVEFYRQVEQGAAWPTQMASGFVTSLAMPMPVRWMSLDLWWSTVWPTGCGPLKGPVTLCDPLSTCSLAVFKVGSQIARPNQSGLNWQLCWKQPTPMGKLSMDF